MKKTLNHHITKLNNEALVTDIFDDQSPFGVLGKLAKKLFLEEYALLRNWNQILRGFEESDN